MEEGSILPSLKCLAVRFPATGPEAVAAAAAYLFVKVTIIHLKCTAVRFPATIPTVMAAA